ncbi:MAG: fatty-acid--CoA ligase, partial [Mycobacterium sp.]
AQQWIDHLDAAAEWMSGAGSGAHPSLFVGQLMHVMTLEATP